MGFLGVSTAHANAPAARPHIIVFGNHKGGTGKSTVAMHVIVALLKEGKRVASFDLDWKQQTLTRYIDNRREWAHEGSLPLELPEHFVFPDVTSDSRARDTEAKTAIFTSTLRELQNDFDFIVIDTPSGSHHPNLLAHGMADTLVTPINDSFVDLDVIVTIGPSSFSGLRPSRYADAVAAATLGRRSVCDRPTDWVVVRNRLSPLASRNQRQVTDVLDLMAPKVGFRCVPGLSERVIFREFFPVGLTAMDPLNGSPLGVKPTMSHLMARLEVRDLVQAIGLLPSPSAQDRDGDGVPVVVEDIARDRAGLLAASVAPLTDESQESAP